MGRLLVIDDNVVQQGIIGRIGAKLGYDTLIAGDFAGASNLLSERSFDGITLDLSLGETMA